jgi:hypothetical protein
MWRMAAAIVLLSPVMLSSRPQPPPPRDRPLARDAGNASIRGRVVAAESNEPLRNARVTLAGDSSVPPTFTGNDGRFTFSALPAGRYTVSARKAGYAPTTYGQRRPESPPLPIELGAADSFQSCELRMPRSAAISGRITDEQGDPMELGSVVALRITPRARFATAVPAATATTDDLGEYRLGSLAAGTYIVTAMTPRPGPGQKRSYYPGVSARVQAQSLVLEAGEERSSTDFTVSQGSLARLTIAFTDPKGEPANAVAVLFNTSLNERGANGAPVVGTVVTTPLEPGDWTIFAHAPDGLTGFARVSMGTADTSLSIPLARGGRITGRVVGEEAPLPRDAALYVEALPDLSADGFMAPPTPAWSARVSDAASFELRELLGPRRLAVRNAPQSEWWFVTGVNYQGRSLLDQTLEFKGGETLSGVQVTVSNHAGTVSGSAVNADGTPVADYFVLVFPDDSSSAARVQRLMRVGRSNQRGRFTIEHVVPGKYLAVALADIDAIAAALPTPDYVNQFRDRAVSFAALDRQTTTLVLTFVP